MLDSSLGNLKKYSLILFKNLEFYPSNNTTSLINAVNVIKDMNDNNKRKNHVCNADGTINKFGGHMDQ
ncbi:hypothetical protein [Clostridium estertheticum]|uniref:hypothetical protein n=1 Tax=Clostridium estertheticum TaxID=238834 RepID=UPI001C6E93AA|nr:hypothetical protein [Clostridium estertheticum]MBW9153854.1 hypothetical protein [Clostridium estertheticum]WLC86472.1 hypothetical protein KTC97_20250 [Clostridium estertheticum]